MNREVFSIKDAFGDPSDPRSRTPVRGLTQMLRVALCAILAGADSWSGIELWGQAKLGWLRGHVPLKNAIPSHDTLGRVFAALGQRHIDTPIGAAGAHYVRAVKENQL